MNYSVDLDLYRWQNALDWTLCKAHYEAYQDNEGLASRVHLLIAAIEVIPIISQISSLFEILIVRTYNRNRAHPRDLQERVALIPAANNAEARATRQLVPLQAAARVLPLQVARSPVPLLGDAVQQPITTAVIRVAREQQDPGFRRNFYKALNNRSIALAYRELVHTPDVITMDTSEFCSEGGTALHLILRHSYSWNYSKKYAPCGFTKSGDYSECWIPEEFDALFLDFFRRMKEADPKLLHAVDSSLNTAFHYAIRGSTGPKLSEKVILQTFIAENCEFTFGNFLSPLISIVDADYSEVLNSIIERRSAPYHAQIMQILKLFMSTDVGGIVTSYVGPDAELYQALNVDYDDEGSQYSFSQTNPLKKAAYDKARYPSRILDVLLRAGADPTLPLTNGQSVIDWVSDHPKLKQYCKSGQQEALSILRGERSSSVKVD